MLQRSLVALTALKLGLASRAQLLIQHRVTEADLHHYRADWERQQALRAAEELGASLKLRRP